MLRPKKVLLLLRSYGDFVVALHFIDDLAKHFNIIASAHLEPLITALEDYNFSLKNKITFKQFNIKRGLFSGYTNKYLLTKETYQEYKQIKQQINQLKESSIFFEQSHFFNYLLSKNFFIHHQDNIYDSYQEISNTTNLYNLIAKKDIKSIVIFPDSRKREKELTESFVYALQTELFAKHDTLVATFKTTNVKYINNTAYNSFIDLCSLISKADFIISSDSLPAHLASLFQKPHWTVYRNNINYPWLTPFTKNNHTYSIENNDISIKSIKAYLENS